MTGRDDYRKGVLAGQGHHPYLDVTVSARRQAKGTNSSCGADGAVVRIASCV